MTRTQRIRGRRNKRKPESCNREKNSFLALLVPNTSPKPLHYHYTRQKKSLYPDLGMEKMYFISQITHTDDKANHPPTHDPHPSLPSTSFLSFLIQVRALQDQRGSSALDAAPLLCEGFGKRWLIAQNKKALHKMSVPGGRGGERHGFHYQCCVCTCVCTV